MNGLDAIAKAVGTVQSVKPKLDRLEKATEGFESAFIKQLLSNMRKGMPDSFGKDPGAEIYRDMMDQAIADDAAKTGMLGIGKMLYKQMSPMVIAQEQAKLRLKVAAETVDTKA